MTTKPTNRSIVKIVLFIIILSTVSVSLASASDDAIVKHIIDLARQNLSKAILSDGSHPAAETDEEKKTDIIPFQDARRAVRIGQESAYAEWCGIGKPNSHYNAFMKHERSTKKWTDKQLAYIGVLHGITVGMFLDAMEEKGKCDPQQREELQGIISSRQNNDYWD